MHYTNYKIVEITSIKGELKLEDNNNHYKICIETNQANVDAQCIQEIIDLLVINPTQVEIEEILKDYKVIYRVYKDWLSLY